MNYSEEYGRLHRNPKRFPGFSVLKHSDEIASLVIEHNAKTLLDYGCGKGRQYFEKKVHMKWGVVPWLYDAGVPEFSKKPLGKFDGVICTDVLEHIEEADLPGFLDEVFSYADKFVFFSVSCSPTKPKTGKSRAHKSLSDGRDLHVTVKPPSWWGPLLEKHRPSHVALSVAYEDI